MKRTRSVRDAGLSSRTNFPGEIQQHAPVRSKHKFSTLQRDVEIGKRLIKATAKK